MHKTTILSLISLFALLLSQGYWFHKTYEDFKETQRLIINELFENAINNEAVIRLSDKHKYPHYLPYFLKKAKDMTMEEHGHLKGDLINLDEALEKNIGKELSDVFAQNIQDKFLYKRPIRLETLDTLFNNSLARKGIHTTFLISLYDHNLKKIKQIDHSYEKEKNYILTELHPIGMHGLQFAQARVALPAYIIFYHTLYALIISLLIICILFYCICYQLYAIHHLRLQLKEREKSVYIAIHDLKKPLNGIFCLLDFLQHTSIKKEIIPLFQNSKRQICKLVEIIESMLYGLKDGYPTITLNSRETNLPETLKYIEKQLKPFFENKKYTFVIENPENIQTIRTDTFYLERCLSNLIENALKYSDENVTVKAILSSNVERVCIAIQDNGWGIPLKLQKRIGKQFFRAKQINKPTREGYGIGLSSVQHLVAMLNGKFNFKSMEGVGSTFYIHLLRTTP